MRGGGAAHSAHVTRMAEQMRVQREALRAGLIGELLATLLRGREGGWRGCRMRNAYGK